MKIAVISNDLQSFQVQDLIKTSKKLNVNLDVLSLNTLQLSTTKLPELETLKKYDLVYYRAGDTPIIRNIFADYCQKNQIKFVNSAYYHSPLCGNKLNQVYEVLKISPQIKVPQTVTVEPSTNSDNYYSWLTDNLGKTFIAKPTSGHQGEGVRKISNLKQYQDLIKESYHGLESMIFQEMIPNTGDYRVFTINHQAIAMMKRTPAKGEFRSNFSQGGSVAPVVDEKISKCLAPIAEAISQHFSLEIAGIDLMRSEKDECYYFIEANSIPQWEGLSQACNINIAEKIINFLCQK
jgi:RimK family alpha-L-glutamate ligase